MRTRQQKVLEEHLHKEEYYFISNIKGKGSKTYKLRDRDI